MFLCEKEKSMTDKPASYFTEQLLRIFPCKVPFVLRILHTKPKGRCGSYWKHNRHILINDKFITLDTRRCMEVAIHEYAHHLHYTEFGKEEKKDKPHGPEFWMIYGQLMNRAIAIGIDVDPFGPIVDFGVSEREPPTNMCPNA